MRGTCLKIKTKNEVRSKNAGLRGIVMKWSENQVQLVGSALNQWEKRYGKLANKEFHEGCKVLSKLLFHVTDSMNAAHLVVNLHRLNKIEHQLEPESDEELISDQLSTQLYYSDE